MENIAVHRNESKFCLEIKKENRNENLCPKFHEIFKRIHEVNINFIDKTENRRKQLDIKA